MRKIIRKDSNKINYAYIFNWDTIEVKENYHDIEEINLDSMFNDIKEMKFKYSVWPKNFVVGDFVIDSFDQYCVISQRVYNYLFIDNPEMSLNISVKPIDLISSKSLMKEDGQYYLIYPKRVFIECKEKINGIGWSCYKYKDIYLFNLNISDNYIKDFNKQKFVGITLEKYEEPAPAPENIYYVSNETNVKKKISNFLQEVSKKKILKSKCKYIYYTIIEEENGYTLGVAGYMNKYFDDETFSFDPNMCELTNTDLGKIEWKECMVKLQEIIREIYSINDSDFYKVKAFIGFHDSDIYNIN